MGPHATTIKPTGTGEWTDGQDHVLSQADALTKKGKNLLALLRETFYVSFVLAMTGS